MANCSICSKQFTRRSSRHVLCSPDCAVIYNRGVQAARAAKARREDDKRRKQALKSMTELANDAQTEFNSFIRERDKVLPCISCGQSAYQGQRHASHYRSRAAAPQLRFNVFNCHTSCAQCNSMKSGNVVEYRIELVKRIGQHRVEALECNNSRARFDRDYLVRMKEVFRRRTKHLRKIRSVVKTDGF